MRDIRKDYFLYKKFVEHHVIKLILLKISNLSARLTQAIIRNDDDCQSLSNLTEYLQAMLRSYKVRHRKMT